MSSEREQWVYRVPRSLCGIQGYQEQQLLPFPGRGGSDERCLLPVMLDWDEFLEEHEKLFDWDVGKFSESLSEGDYIDFVLLDRYVYSGWGDSCSEDEEVFHKILPDLDLEAVHYCEYEWYDGTNAPDVY